MFRWYREADECSPYLNDVVCDAEYLIEVTFAMFSWVRDIHQKKLNRRFATVSGFTKGWTLQGLSVYKNLYLLGKNTGKGYWAVHLGLYLGVNDQ